MKKDKNELFKERVFDLVGDEYVFLGEYQKAKTKIEVIHTKCGHKYESSPDNFYSGSKCPKCFGGVRRTDAEFLDIITGLVNDEYTFLEKYKNGHHHLEVTHNVCGNLYRVRPTAFIHLGHRCPKCEIERRRNLLKSENTFSSEVYDLVGDEYTFQEKYKGGLSRIKIKHNLCGNVYKVTPQRFKAGNRCKKCSDDKQRKSNEDFIKGVSEDVGVEYVFLEEYVNAQTAIEVKHNKCNHIYKVTPNNFLRGSRCPNCFISKGEEKIAEYLEGLGILFEREVSFLDLRDEGLLRYDFGVINQDGEIKQLLEYDGVQHYEPIEFWGGDKELVEVKKRDKMKDSYAKNIGVSLKRIPYWEFDNIEDILSTVVEDIK